MAFPCTSCGCCCKHLNIALEIATNNPNREIRQIAAEFPYTPDPDGSCPMLLSNNLCAIYQSRPLICQVEALGERVGFNKDRWIAHSIRNCNRLMDMDDAPQHFRILYDENTAKTKSVSS